MPFVATGQSFKPTLPHQNHTLTSADGEEVRPRNWL
jgi:hypothetical protein